ncbi:XkdQ/YqbQ family protein [Clostridium botulinum]|uniref:XkdQ/YqbQ family protein n=1 Tax=Clostridium botulinum TaxID=1491 RepID=UPI003DA5855D
MSIQLLLDNKKGEIYDISELTSEVTWKTKRKDKPSSLDFEILKDKQITINNGDVISFKVDGNPVFYGYVFENGGNKNPIIKMTAYDQLRYLLFNDTYVFKNKKASQILMQIAKDIGLRVGTIEDTGYVIPQLLEDDKKLLDIIYSSLEKTLLNSKKTYTLYDDFGYLNLRNINNLRQEVVISDDNNLGDYDWKNSIDSDTYNRVKIVRDNKDTKGRDVYIAQDSRNIAKWGRLQYYKKVDEKMNKAQIQEMVNAALKLKNRETKTLKLKDVISTDIAADLKLRAGSGVYVDIKEKGIKQYYLIEEATHKFQKGNLVMDFDLKVV